MEVGCLRHPGASTVGSQLLDPWRLLPWLANPGNPAMSSHAEGEKKTGTCHTDKTVERKGGTGEGDSLQGVPALRRKTLEKR